MTGLMKGKRGLIMGLANDKSLAWGIAKALHGAGAELAISYQGEVMLKRVKPLADELGCDLLIDCDVSDMANLDQAFATLAARWPTIDFVVHAIGYTNKEALRGNYADIGLEDFLMTMNISVYSFTAVARRAAAMMPPKDPETGEGGGAMLTLSYYGAEKVIPHYNVMGVAKSALETSVKYLANDYGPQGVRVNAISAGPIKTLAASGIGDFRLILKWNEYNAPLRRNVTIDDVGGSALYLLSDLASGVTGETHHVDAGYHTIGMKQEDAPDIALA
ncbi:MULTISPECIES: SDR family oxidoreductase [Sphingopyxis]|jgi:enoyl-[acyl-carrier protein] reductase I|uniref:SDR family oxidoreductase n=1 Tax=Sphingopyxis TaxID=165697 RepID=UPI00086BA8B9|nr:MULTISPECIES: SDR family oxidoreductase [Sphingopyxis]APW72219.1 enoyl-ACP reductase [Sphingopyxis granuli]AVA13054.1 enoyl-[acyl-carrier-protein] reductase FabI [Sphingopyxis sp. MG]ODU30460.1 MAG: enoyl-ACP reductase [Sphingopyxis sp. SCN 67-31]QUM71975.1 SDR family oxidoreductase [Sphingopyxis granuli]